MKAEPATKRIPLSHGLFALVDSEDYDRLMQWRWRPRKPGTVWYVIRTAIINGKEKKFQMHREVMRLEDHELVDHIDRNGLNNTKANLRRCTHLQNQWNKGVSKNNTSGFKGVSWDNGHKKWQAQIFVKGKTIRLGRYFCIVKAAMVYDAAIRKYHGEFGYTNFPIQQKQTG